MFSDSRKVIDKYILEGNLSSEARKEFIEHWKSLQDSKKAVR